MEQVSTTGTIGVIATNTINRTSAAGTDNQTVCVNTPITNITYATTGATGATITGLPTGVTGSWAANVVTITGTPSVTAGSPYNYTITLNGGCGTITATGTIRVTPNNTISKDISSRNGCSDRVRQYTDNEYYICYYRSYQEQRLRDYRQG